MPCNQFPLTQRRKAWGRITILFALIALAITVLPTASFAGTDTAGNVLATDNDANPSGVEGDLYWAGQALNLDDVSIDRDIIAAGDTLSIRDCTVGGAVRLAARTIDIAKTTVDGSVTVAGQHIILDVYKRQQYTRATGVCPTPRHVPHQAHRTWWMPAGTSGRRRRSGPNGSWPRRYA